MVKVDTLIMIRVFLLVVVNNKKQEVSLKKLIKKVDPSAFIIVSDVHEVLGEGFKSIAA